MHLSSYIYALGIEIESEQKKIFEIELSLALGGRNQFSDGNRILSI